MTETPHRIRLCNETIDRPGHICAFFDSSLEYYDTVVPFFRDGVDAGETVVNVVDDGQRDAHAARLIAAGLPVGTSDVSVLSTSETYLLGGDFDMERMTAFVTNAVSAAARDGKRVRTAGSMSWVAQRPGNAHQAMEYEARMNLLVPAYDCTFMCVYDLAYLSGELLIDILSTHRYAIFRGRIRENSFFVPPERYLAELLQRGSSLTQ